ncbi:hypothetical protein ACS0TY_013298 [Phlomoides rotata]
MGLCSCEKFVERNQEMGSFDSLEQQSLAWYNEHDQPICRVCDVVLKSEPHWLGHQASCKHNEAIEKFKARDAALNRSNNAKPESSKILLKPGPESSRELNKKYEPSIALPTHRSFTLPTDFLIRKRLRDRKLDSDSAKTQAAEALISGSETDKSYTATSTQMGNPEVLGSKDFRQVSQVETGLESKQVKGALPVGFFDDKDPDLCARRVTPVKPDVKWVFLLISPTPPHVC